MSLETSVLPDFTPEQFVEIEKLSGMGWNLKKIAMYLNCSYRAFQYHYDHCEDVVQGTIRYHYERGILMVQAGIDIQLADKAKEGNLTAIQMYEKKAEKNKMRDLKNDILNGNI